MNKILQALIILMMGGCFLYSTFLLAPNTSDILRILCWGYSTILALIGWSFVIREIRLSGEEE